MADWEAKQPEYHRQAFPLKLSYREEEGIRLREYFAIKALQSILNRELLTEIKENVTLAYYYADEMMKEHKSLPDKR